MVDSTRTPYVTSKHIPTAMGKQVSSIPRPSQPIPQLKSVNICKNHLCQYIDVYEQKTVKLTRIKV